MKKTLFSLILVLIVLLGGCTSQHPEVTTEPTVTETTARSLAS